MTEHPRALTLELLTGKGTPDDLRLDEFLEELEAVKIALRETERLVSGQEPSLYFKIRRLQKNSPAIIELEAESSTQSTPRFASYVVRTLTTNLKVIGTRNRPRKIDVATLNAYEEMTRPLERHGLQVIVKSGKTAVKIDRDFRDAIQAVMGEDESSYGSLSGRIEAMTTHSRNAFRLYPAVGATRVLGSFAAHNRSKFAAGMDKYVTVWGKVKYKTWDQFPYAIAADDIDIHDGDPVSLLDLRGMAPEATGVLTAREFVDELRDE